MNKYTGIEKIKKRYCSSFFKTTPSKEFPEYLFVGDTENGAFPILLPFKFSKGFIFDIGIQEQGINEIMETIQNIVLKLFLSIEKNYLKVTVIDLGYGATFQILRRLMRPNVPIAFITNQNLLDKFLDESISEARNIEDQILLQKNLGHLSDFNVNSNVVKPYHLIVVPNFPKELSVQQVAKLNDLMLYANRSGVLLILGYWHSIIEKTRTNTYNGAIYPFDSFTSNMQRINIALKGIEPLYNVSEEIRYKIVHSDFIHIKITNEEIAFAINKINELYKKEDIPDKNEDFLTIPIGYDENGNRQYFSLGQRSQSYHVMISGVTGAGKSTFLNNIITQIAELYSPDDIRLYLMDYKDGVEFHRYRGHPNVELLHLDNNNYNMAVETLESFVKEASLRNTSFQTTGVSNITGYNAKFPDKKLHHKILIIDEIQRIFKVKNVRKGDNLTSIDISNKIKGLLEIVATKCRSSGLHLIICSQTFKSIDKIYDFSDSFNVRIGFRHEEIGSAKPLGLEKDATKIEYFQIIYRTPKGERFIPKLDSISDDEVEKRLKKFAAFPNQKVIEANQEINIDGDIPKTRGGFK